MDKYDPSIPPIPEEWLALSEDDRVELVRSYHEINESPMEGGRMEAHAGIHVVIEKQIAMAFEPVPATVARLTRQGLSRHETIHAVGAVLSGEIWQLQQHSESKWEPGAYRRKLDKLTAKRWKKGHW